MLHPSIRPLIREPSVSFNAENHTYPHKNTGELYKGCTTIANLADKPFLAPWYAAEMAKAILKIPFEAIQTGTPEQFASLINESKSRGSPPASSHLIGHRPGHRTGDVLS